MPTIQNTSSGNGSRPTLRSLQAELTEIAKVHDVAVDLIERSNDVDDLLDHILGEYESRLKELPRDVFAEDGGAKSPVVAAKLRALFAFAAEAAALKEKATAAAEIRARADALAEANTRIGQALADAEAARSRLDGVLSALDAGILILGPGGEVEHVNAAARRIAGSGAGADERPPSHLLVAVPRGADAEVRVAGESGEGRVLMVGRRDLENGAGEVVLLNDITRRSGEIEERHRIEKLAEVMRALSVLSHKINNPLTALLGRAQILKMTAGTDEKSLKAARVIEESATRIADLIRELAAVVREGQQEAVDKILTMHPETGVDGGAR